MHGVGPTYDVDVNINTDNIKKILDDNLHPDLAHRFSKLEVLKHDNHPERRLRSTQDYNSIKHDYSQQPHNKSTIIVKWFSLPTVLTYCEPNIAIA